MTKPIIQYMVVPPDADKESIKQLRDAGVCVIVTSQPDKVRIVMPTVQVTSSAMLMAAMHALKSERMSQTAHEMRAVFVDELVRRMEEEKGKE